MGEIAEMMLDGTLCSQCGVLLENSLGDFPQTCPACSQDDQAARRMFPKTMKRFDKALKKAKADVHKK